LSKPKFKASHLSANSLTSYEQDGANTALLGLWTVRRRLFDKDFAASVTVSQVESALARGAKIESKDKDGYTSLMWAAWSGNLAVVDTLIAAGAKTETPDYNRDTALIWAVRESNIECEKLLISAGANVNATGNFDQTPLMEAAKNGDGASVDLLLENGADVNAANMHGATALIFAADANSAYCMRQLVNLRADVNASALFDMSTLTYHTALSVAARSASRSNNTEAIRYLASVAGERPRTDLDVPELNGFTPLMESARNGNVHAVEILVNLGANVNASDRMGRTALTWAADHPDIIAILKAAGAE
jgi:ankyrin repeat protein